MFGIGILELLIIFLAITLCFGPDKLPEIAKNIARLVGKLRRFQHELQYSAIWEERVVEKKDSKVVVEDVERKS